MSFRCDWHGDAGALRGRSRGTAPTRNQAVLQAHHGAATTLSESLANPGPPDEVMVARHNLSLSRRALECLAPHRWLSDEVINFVFGELRRAAERQSSGFLVSTPSFGRPRGISRLLRPSAQRGDGS